MFPECVTAPAVTQLLFLCFPSRLLFPPAFCLQWGCGHDALHLAGHTCSSSTHQWQYLNPGLPLKARLFLLSSWSYVFSCSWSLSLVASVVLNWIRFLVPGSPAATIQLQPLWQKELLQENLSRNPKNRPIFWAAINEHQFMILRKHDSGSRRCLVCNTCKHSQPNRDTSCKFTHIYNGCWCS